MDKHRRQVTEAGERFDMDRSIADIITELQEIQQKYVGREINFNSDDDGVEYTVYRWETDDELKDRLAKELAKAQSAEQKRKEAAQLRTQIDLIERQVRAENDKLNEMRERKRQLERGY